MAWSAEENKSLLEFVLQSGDTGSWPSHARASPFWEDAACFVFQESSGHDDYRVPGTPRLETRPYTETS